MADGSILYGTTTLDALKSKAGLATNSSGDIIEATPLDISGKVNIDQGSPQTLVGTFNFQNIITDGSAGTYGVYDSSGGGSYFSNGASFGGGIATIGQSGIPAYFSTVTFTTYVGWTCAVDASDNAANTCKLCDGSYAINANGVSSLPTIMTTGIKPQADSTTAIRIYKADGTTPFIIFDTLNQRFGIGGTPITSQFYMQVPAAETLGMVVNGDTTPATNAGNVSIASFRRTFNSNSTSSMNPTGILCVVTNSSIQTGTGAAAITNVGQAFSVLISGAHSVVPSKAPPSETNIGYQGSVNRSGTLAWKTGGTITCKGLDLTSSNTQNINISGGTMASNNYGMYATCTSSCPAETAGTHTVNAYGAYYFVNGATTTTGVTTGYGQWAKVNAFDNCYGFVIEITTTTGNGYAVWVAQDDSNGNGKIHFGAAKDATIGFTGTQMLIQSDVVTSTDSLQIRGGTNGVLFNVGATQQLAITSLTGTLVDGFNFVFGTSTGTKFGTGTTQKIGFYNKAPVVQQTGVASQKVDYAAGNLDTEAEIITALNTTNAAINTLRTALNNLGLTSTV